jgi:hypothetical protein
MKHYGGGPVQGGIGKVGNQTGMANERVNAKAEGSTIAMSLPKAVTSKVMIGKGDAIHGKMKGQSAGSHGGNVHAGKYHKPFGG